MTDSEIQQCNRQLADWITRLDTTKSLIADGSEGKGAALLAAWANLNGMRNEMQAVALNIIPMQSREQSQGVAPQGN